eukprot:416082_1
MSHILHHLKQRLNHNIFLHTSQPQHFKIINKSIQVRHYNHSLFSQPHQFNYSHQTNHYQLLFKRCFTSKSSIDFSKDYYKILGIKKNAKRKQIRSAFNKLVHKWHPDKHKNPVNKKKARYKFIEIHEAKTVLLNQESKYEYDQQRSNHYDNNNRFYNHNHTTYQSQARQSAYRAHYECRNEQKEHFRNRSRQNTYHNEQFRTDRSADFKMDRKWTKRVVWMVVGVFFTALFVGFNDSEKLQLINEFKNIFEKDSQDLDRFIDKMAADIRQCKLLLSCPLCFDIVKDESVSLECGHNFHMDCYDNNIGETNLFWNSDSDMQFCFVCQTQKRFIAPGFEYDAKYIDLENSDSVINEIEFRINRYVKDKEWRDIISKDIIMGWSEAIIDVERNTEYIWTDDIRDIIKL